MKNPEWVVCYNIKSKPDKWVGTGWEFFDKETDAEDCYDHQIAIGNCPTKRKYYDKTDIIHLGAIHLMKEVIK